MTVLQLWLALAASAAVILVAGYQLSHYGDVIARHTGLGGNWIGLVLMATVTSLPELATGVSSVTLANAPDVAVGNVLGACVVNLAALAILDFAHRKSSIYLIVSEAHTLAAGYGILMLGIVAIGLLIGGVVPGMNAWLWIFTWSLPVVYGVAIRTVFVFETNARKSAAEPTVEIEPNVTLRQASVRYTIAAVFVIGAGLGLPFIATGLADAMGWSTTFVGTLLIAITTTLPELTVTLAALRIGAIDMAVGNLLGSNLFNIIILFIDDVLYRPGPLFASVSPAHAVTALSAVVMLGALTVALIARPRSRFIKTFGLTSVFLILIYLGNAWVQFATPA
jgi:cation:H+ antiporter